MKFLDFNSATTCYIRKIKNEHRIMSQATNKAKKLVSPLSNISNYFDAPKISLHYRLNALSLKIKTELNLTLAAFVIYSHDFPFFAVIWYVVVGRQSHLRA